MKKVILLATGLLTLGVIFLASCGQPATESTTTTDSTTVAVDTAAVVDSCATVDTTVAAPDTTK